jgi:hypothetical protein
MQNSYENAHKIDFELFNSTTCIVMGKKGKKKMLAQFISQTIITLRRSSPQEKQRRCYCITL